MSQNAPKKKISVALLIENAIFLKGVKTLVNSFDGFQAVAEATNISDFTQIVQSLEQSVEICLLDINIHEAGFRETIHDLRQYLPAAKMIILSNHDHSYSIIKALQYGANGHLSKLVGTAELHRALLSVHYTGQYFNENVISKKLEPEAYQHYTLLTERELNALTLLCSEMTYQEIADQLKLSVQIVEGYRDVLFEKLAVTSRVGLIVCAHKMGINTSHSNKQDA